MARIWPAQLDPVHAGHLDIQQDAIELPVGVTQKRQRLGAGPGPQIAPVPLHGKDGIEDIMKDGLVIDREDSHIPLIFHSRSSVMPVSECFCNVN